MQQQSLQQTLTPEQLVRDFCGRHGNWWPSLNQVRDMLALVTPAQGTECLCGICKLGDRVWVDLDHGDRRKLWMTGHSYDQMDEVAALLKGKNT